MAMAKRNEGSKISSDINVTPMVDVMLVLLIIFMVVMPFIQHPHFVEMARTEHPVAMADADRDNAIVVAVTRDGIIYLEDNRVGLDELNAKITDRLQRRNDRRVFVKADARARYGAVVEVVDQLRSANVEELGLLTEQQSKHMLPPSSDAGRKKELKT